MACDKGVTFIARMVFAIYGPQIEKKVQLNSESDKKVDVSIGWQMR